MSDEQGQLFRESSAFIEAHAQPLMEPRMVAASEADHMRGDDMVLGLSLTSEARAYPWWIMDDHHVANDVVGGRAVMIMLCEACSTGMAFDRMVKGRRLTFQQTHVYNGTIALEDYQTQSIWSPYLASAIQGELKGARLQLLPLSQMEWAAWRDLHPETLVLAGELGERHGHGSGCSIELPWMPTEFAGTVGNWDDRLPQHELILGVVAPSGQRAYPLRTLRRRRGVINDDVRGFPIVVILHRAEGSYAALAFSRELDGRTLTFRRTPRGAVDRETGSVWTAEGRAISGPLAGTRLAFVDSHVSKWYVWAAHYPDIEIA